MFLHREGLRHFQRETVSVIEHMETATWQASLKRFGTDTVSHFLKYADDIEKHLQLARDDVVRKLHGELVKDVLVPLLAEKGSIPPSYNDILTEVNELEASYEKFIENLRKFQQASAGKWEKLDEKGKEDAKLQLQFLYRNTKDIEAKSNHLVKSLRTLSEVQLQGREKINLEQKYLNDDIKGTNHFQANLASWFDFEEAPKHS
jgi:hypothetical protein